MARKPRKYTWYLEPRGNVTYSNKIISENVGEENASEKICADGKKRKLWQCPSGLVFMIWNSRAGFSKLGQKFGVRIFCQEGNGQIRDVTRVYASQNGKRRPYAKF